MSFFWQSLSSLFFCEISTKIVISVDWIILVASLLLSATNQASWEWDKSAGWWKRRPSGSTWCACWICHKRPRTWNQLWRKHYYQSLKILAKNAWSIVAQVFLETTFWLFFLVNKSMFYKHKQYSRHSISSIEWRT